MVGGLEVEVEVEVEVVGCRLRSRLGVRLGWVGLIEGYLNGKKIKRKNGGLSCLS